MKPLMPHVTLAGDRDGEYVIREERPDGTLLLTPETAYEASLRKRGMRAATGVEFEAWVAENGPLLPSDDEG